jgi:hypothetical protein
MFASVVIFAVLSYFTVVFVVPAVVFTIYLALAIVVLSTE